MACLLMPDMGRSKTHSSESASMPARVCPYPLRPVEPAVLVAPRHGVDQFLVARGGHASCVPTHSMRRASQSQLIRLMALRNLRVPILTGCLCG